MSDCFRLDPTHAWVDDAHTWTQGVEAIAYGLKGQRC